MKNKYLKNNKNKNRDATPEVFQEIADEKKREFIKKFGKYATTLPAGVLLLMSAGTSKAHAASDSAR